MIEDKIITGVGVLCLGIIWLIAIFGMKKCNVFSEIKMLAGKDKKLTALVAAGMVGLISIAVAGMDFLHINGYVDVFFDLFFAEIYKDLLFIQLVQACLFVVPAILIGIITIRRMLRKIRLYDVPMFLLLGVTLLNRSFYQLVVSNITEMVEFLLITCVATCIVSILLEKLSKKKVLFLVVMVAMLGIVMFVNGTYAILSICNWAIIVIESLAIGLLMKYSSLFRKIWRLAIILLFYAIVFFINYSVL